MHGERQTIRVGHSPDPDDAFMFYALAKDRIDTGPYAFQHELVDIETLNRRAFRGELELTAVSLHAYAYLTDLYSLCTCGASMGDGYGPMVVTRDTCSVHELRERTIGVPGTLTTAYLALRMCLATDVHCLEVPFDKIMEATVAGHYEGQRVDAGLIIHEGQLTYRRQQLQRVIDLGEWWQGETGLPLPLGANAVRKDLGGDAQRDINRLLRESIQYGLEHRSEALEYALGFGRDLERTQADTFVGMYVNHWTMDFGSRGREAVRLLLARGYASGVLPKPVDPEFVA